MTNYKVLSLWEPWASLLVTGEKKIETRPSATNWILEKDIYGNTIKGTYLIHSAKKWTKEQRELCGKEPFKSTLEKYYSLWVISESPRRPHFNFGHIIGAVDVIKCMQILNLSNEKMKEPGAEYKYVSPYEIDDKEMSFGDYREDRYAWICSNPRILKTPIPYKGGQGYYQNFKGDINQLEFITL